MRRKKFLALKIDEIAAGYWLQIHLLSFCVLREFLLIYFSCFEIEYYFSCLPLYTKARMEIFFRPSFPSFVRFFNRFPVFFIIYLCGSFIVCPFFHRLSVSNVCPVSGGKRDAGATRGRFILTKREKLWERG